MQTAIKVLIFCVLPVYSIPILPSCTKYYSTGILELPYPKKEKENLQIELDPSKTAVSMIFMNAALVRYTVTYPLLVSKIKLNGNLICQNLEKDEQLPPSIPLRRQKRQGMLESFVEEEDYFYPDGYVDYDDLTERRNLRLVLEDYFLN